MFSSDKNVETIGQLADALKRYAALQTEYAKLDVIDRVVRLLTAASIAVVFGVLLVFVAVFLSLAAVHALSQAVGWVPAYAMVAGFHLLAFWVIYLFRHRWIERPLVRFLARLLMGE